MKWKIKQRRNRKENVQKTHNTEKILNPVNTMVRRTIAPVYMYRPQAHVRGVRVYVYAGLRKTKEREREMIDERCSIEFPIVCRWYVLEYFHLNTQCNNQPKRKIKRKTKRDFILSSTVNWHSSHAQTYAYHDSSENRLSIISRNFMNR